MEKINVKSLLLLVLQLDKEVISSIQTDEYLTNYGLTSINLMQIILLIEEEYKIVFDLDDYFLEKLDTISKIENVIKKYKEKKNGIQ